LSQPPRELHPVLQPAERRRLVAEGVERFNRGAFFDAHESWEEIWRSTTPEPRDLFQGLVQLAAAFHHFAERRRPDVARRVLAKARRRLEPWAAAAAGEGLDLADLLAAIRGWEAWLAEPAGRPPAYPRIRRAAARGAPGA
jgi:predicted metal-dependent hydrolase